MAYLSTVPENQDIHRSFLIQKERGGKSLDTFLFKFNMFRVNKDVKVQRKMFCESISLTTLVWWSRCEIWIGRFNTLNWILKLPSLEGITSSNQRTFLSKITIFLFLLNSLTYISLYDLLLNSHYCPYRITFDNLVSPVVLYDR